MQKYRIRKTRTGSGAKAVQVVYYEDYQTKIAQHIGSAHSEDELEVLIKKARQYIVEQTHQLPLFQDIPPHDVFDHIEVNEVSQRMQPGKRAKFVKKSNQPEQPYLFDEALRQKTEVLLGIKGYCTNIPEERLSNKEIIAYYHELWHVEQAFRISKTDLKARPIFHYSHDAIRAHALICFIGLMIGKFIEIKTGLSIRTVRDMLWQVHDIQLKDPVGERQRIIRTALTAELQNVLDNLNLKITY